MSFTTFTTFTTFHHLTSFTYFHRRHWCRIPFKPTAGATPPDLGRAGRSPGRIRIRPATGIGCAGASTIITGSRGIGKTVMLSAAEAIARDHGWAVISPDSQPGIPGKDRRRHASPCRRARGRPRPRKITAFSAAGFGLTTQLPRNGRSGLAPHRGRNSCGYWTHKARDWSSPLTKIHAVDRTEISQLAADVQHFIRDGLPIGPDLRWPPIGRVRSAQRRRGHLPAASRQDLIFTKQQSPKSVPPTGSFSAKEASTSPRADQRSSGGHRGLPVPHSARWLLPLDGGRQGRLDIGPEQCSRCRSLPPNDGTPWLSSSPRFRTSPTRTASSSMPWPPRTVPLRPVRLSHHQGQAQRRVSSTGTGSSLPA